MRVPGSFEGFSSDVKDSTEHSCFVANHSVSIFIAFLPFTLASFTQTVGGTDKANV